MKNCEKIEKIEKIGQKLKKLAKNALFRKYEAKTPFLMPQNPFCRIDMEFCIAKNRPILSDF